MKKFFSLIMGIVLFLGVQALKADDMGKGTAMSTPGMSTTPKAKPAAKAKKTKKSKKAVKAVWACPMGDYSGPKTKDGKCPKCGMDLVEQK